MYKFARPFHRPYYVVSMSETVRQVTWVEQSSLYMSHSYSAVDNPQADTIQVYANLVD